MNNRRKRWYSRTQFSTLHTMYINASSTNYHHQHHIYPRHNNAPTYSRNTIVFFPTWTNLEVGFRLSHPGVSQGVILPLFIRLYTKNEQTRTSLLLEMFHNVLYCMPWGNNRRFSDTRWVSLTCLPGWRVGVLLTSLSGRCVGDFRHHTLTGSGGLNNSFWKWVLWCSQI